LTSGTFSGISPLLQQDEWLQPVKLRFSHAQALKEKEKPPS